MLSKALKLLHTVGAIGLAGALAAHLVLLAYAPAPTAVAEYAAVRRGIVAVGDWILLPSLLLVLTSGLLSLAARPAFRDAAWAWIKAALGLLMFEGTLATVQGPSEQAAALAARAAAGEVEAAAVVRAVEGEWRGVSIILTLALANVVLGIWRPQLGWLGGSRSPSAATTGEGDAPAASPERLGRD